MIAPKTLHLVIFVVLSVKLGSNYISHAEHGFRPGDRKGGYESKRTEFPFSRLPSLAG